MFGMDPNTDPPVNKMFRAKWLLKKMMLTDFSDMKRYIKIDVLKKGASVNNSSARQILRQNFTLFIK